MEQHLLGLEAKYKRGRSASGPRRMLAHGRRRFRAGGATALWAACESRGGIGPGPRMAGGLLRPITWYPFPVTQIRELSRRAKGFAVVELSNGQLVDDVRLALEGRRPVEFYNRMGGNVPSAEEVLGVLWSGSSQREEVLIHG